MSVLRLLSLAVVAGAVTACGGAASRPSESTAHPDRESAAPERSSKESESAVESEPARERKTTQGGCDPVCGKRLEEASRLGRQAAALKGESKAKTALGERAGETYVKAWMGCDLARPGGQDLGCAGAEKVADDMAQAFANAGRDDRVVFAHLVALDPRFRVEGSESVRRAEEELGRLVERLEQRAENEPKQPHAGMGLVMAVYGRIVLGDAEKAGRDAARLRPFGRDIGEHAALATAALGAFYADQESWDKALAVLSNAPAANEPPRVQILWHAARGRALAGLGKRGAAAEEFGRVLGIYRPPEPKDQAKMLGHSAPFPMLGRESVVDAVGAAQVFFGDEPRLAAQRLKMPAYAGPASAQGVSQYIKGPVAQWIAKEQKLVADAEARYRAIAEIKPVAPPRWVVAGAAMTGQGYADFADDFREAKVPHAIAQDAELAKAFSRALTEVSQPLLDKAKKSFLFCRKVAEQHKVPESASAACSAWLREH